MAKLDRLYKKRKVRNRKHAAAAKSRKRQLALYEKNGKKGHKKQAAKLGRQMRSHAKAIEKIDRAINKEKSKRPASGTGAWGGSKSIVVNEVAPVARNHGAPKSSAKRGISHWATIANPSSDHSVLALTAFAQDYATYDGEKLAKNIARKLGISGYSVGNYNNYYIVRNGITFRVQILWAVSGHYDHVHVGIRRA